MSPECLLFHLEWVSRNPETQVVSLGINRITFFQMIITFDQIIVPVGCKINHNLYTSRNMNENCYGTMSLAGSTKISEMWCVRKNIPWNKWNDVHNLMVTLLWLLIENFFFASAEISFFKLNCNYAEIIVFAELLSILNKMSPSWPGWFSAYNG